MTEPGGTGGDGTVEEPPAPSRRDARRSRRAHRARRSWPQRFALAGLVALSLICLLAASGLSWSIQTIKEWEAVDLARETSGVATAAPGEPENFLLVGIDNEAGLDPNNVVNIGRLNDKNTDTMIVMRVDPAAKAVAMMSFPRDLRVRIGADDAGFGGHQGKINSVLAEFGPLGGPAALVKTIKQNFDVDIHHYIQVDLAGFTAIVERIGGVPMQFAYPAKDEKSNLYQFETGCVTLNAEQALGLARSRDLHVMKPGTNYWQQDGGDDRARSRRQQELIRASLKQVITQGARNPWVANDLIHQGLQSVKTDLDLSIGDLVELATTFRDFDPAAIDTYQLGVDDAEDGTYDLLLRERESQPVLELFRGHNPLKEIRTLVRVEVWNTTNDLDKAGAVGFDLGVNKFTITSVRDDRRYRGMPSRILYAEGYKLQAVILARYLDLNVPIEQGSPDDPSAAVVVVVGDDWKPLRAEPRPLSDFRAVVPELFPADVPTDASAPEPQINLAVPTAIVSGEVPTALEGCD